MRHIHNRYLPTWLHRLCNGVIGTALSATLASLGLSRFPPGHLLHRLAALLLYLSLPIGIFMALIATRFSIVEGLAGEDGYDELNNRHDKDKT